MERPRSEIFAKAADKLEARSKIASDKDDPKWLRRHAKTFCEWASKKKKALEHKQQQKKQRRS